MHIAQLYCIGWALAIGLSVRLSAAFRYCAKTVQDRAMKFGSIMESHTRIPYPLLVLGYDDPKGQKTQKTQNSGSSLITDNVTEKYGELIKRTVPRKALNGA